MGLIMTKCRLLVIIVPYDYPTYFCSIHLENRITVSSKFFYGKRKSPKQIKLEKEKNELTPSQHLKIEVQRQEKHASLEHCQVD